MLTIKTADLRALVTATLNQTPGKTYYGSAVRTAVNPYKVFTLVRVDLGDLSRDDFDLCVDVYDRATDPKRVDEIADKIERFYGARSEQDATLQMLLSDVGYFSDPELSEFQNRLYCSLWPLASSMHDF